MIIFITNNPYVKCPGCGVELFSLCHQQVIKHINKCHGNKRLKCLCDGCDKDLKNTRGLKPHWRSQDHEDICLKCGHHSNDQNMHNCSDTSKILELMASKASKDDIISIERWSVSSMKKIDDPNTIPSIDKLFEKYKRRLQSGKLYYGLMMSDSKIFWEESKKNMYYVVTLKLDNYRVKYCQGCLTYHTKSDIKYCEEKRKKIDELLQKDLSSLECNSKDSDFEFDYEAFKKILAFLKERVVSLLPTTSKNYELFIEIKYIKYRYSEFIFNGGVITFIQTRVSNNTKRCFIIQNKKPQSSDVVSLALEEELRKSLSKCTIDDFQDLPHLPEPYDYVSVRKRKIPERYNAILKGMKEHDIPYEVKDLFHGVSNTKGSEERIRSIFAYGIQPSDGGIYWDKNSKKEKPVYLGEFNYYPTHHRPSGEAFHTILPNGNWLLIVAKVIIPKNEVQTISYGGKDIKPHTNVYRPVDSGDSDAKYIYMVDRKLIFVHSLVEIKKS